MVSKAQLDQEKKREVLFNTLSKKIIGKTPWGKFYGLMRMAASGSEKKEVDYRKMLKTILGV